MQDQLLLPIDGLVAVLEFRRCTPVGEEEEGGKDTGLLLGESAQLSPLS